MMFFDIGRLRITLTSWCYAYHDSNESYGEIRSFVHFWTEHPRWEFRFLWLELRWRVHK